MLLLDCKIEYKLVSAKCIHGSGEDIHIWHIVRMCAVALVADASSRWGCNPAAIVMQVHAPVLSTVVCMLVTQLCWLIPAKQCTPVLIAGSWPMHDMLAVDHFVGYPVYVHTYYSLFIPQGWFL